MYSMREPYAAAGRHNAALVPTVAAMRLCGDRRVDADATSRARRLLV